MAAERSNPTSEEWRLHGRRRAERSYCTFKVRRGDLIQGNEQQLCWCRRAKRTYSMFKVRGATSSKVKSSGCALLEQP